MFVKSVLFTSVFAALASATSSSRLEALLREHPNPSNVTLGHGHSEHPGLQVKRGLGNAIVGNRCDYDIWVWSVDGMGSSDPIHVPARSKYQEPFREPCPGCGVVYKVSNTDQLQAGHHTQFEYAISNNIIYYDISFVDCAQGDSAANCPGHQQGLGIDSPEPACGIVNCPPGEYCPTQSYYVDQPLIKLGIAEPVYGCGNAGAGMDIYFKMCASAPPLKRSIAGRMEIDDMA